MDTSKTIDITANTTSEAMKPFCAEDPAMQLTAAEISKLAAFFGISDEGAIKALMWITGSDELIAFFGLEDYAAMKDILALPDAYPIKLPESGAQTFTDSATRVSEFLCVRHNMLNSERSMYAEQETKPDAG